MADNARSERQLMRQRGAGDREIATANFDFNFEAGSREDRQLMRQRGAGTRQVDEVDFGFHFATPSTVRSRASRIPSKSPGTATRRNVQLRTIPEPLSSTTEMQPPASMRSTRSQDSRSSEQPPRKRRRLSEISNMSRASSVVSPPVKRLMSGVGTIDHEATSIKPQDNAPPSPLFFSNPSADTLSTIDKENDSSILSNASKTNKKKRKRKSIGQQSMRKKRKSSSIQPLPTPPETQEGSVPTTEDQEHDGMETSISTSLSRQSRRWSVISKDSAPELPIEPSETSSSRVPVEPLTYTTLSLQEHLSANDQTQNSLSEVPVHSIEDDVTPDQDEDSESEADELSLEFTGDDTTARTRETSRSQSAIQLVSDANEHSSPDRDARAENPRTASPDQRADMYNQSQIEDDEEADEDYAPVKRTTKSKKQRQRQNVSRQPNISRNSAPPNAPRQQRRPGIPIMTYRASNLNRLPTIEEDAQGDNQSDIEDPSASAPPAFTTRKSPNAVDVLRQACHEAVDARIHDLQESGGLSRTELKNCLIALQSFKTVLHTHLFQISQLLDQRLNLENRIRKSRQEKAELQSRWLELRQARDQLDLKKDATRRRHWANEIIDKRRFQASQAAFALEGAVARGEDGQGEGEDTISGLELRLRTLAKDVSSQAGGGILQNLRSFNALLEGLVNTS